MKLFAQINHHEGRTTLQFEVTDNVIVGSTILLARNVSKQTIKGIMQNDKQSNNIINKVVSHRADDREKVGTRMCAGIELVRVT